MSIAAMLLTIHQKRMLYSAAFTTTSTTLSNNSQRRRALQVFLSPMSHIKFSSSDSRRNGGRSIGTSQYKRKSHQLLKRPFLSRKELRCQPLYAVESRELRFYNGSPPTKGGQEVTDDTLFFPKR